ncbi:potassium/proton antiporter [Muribaculum sp.]|uniref:potassium/proton antiporter n=2 Tax=Muribaculum TaxID=1918540 RepID=UPI00257F6AD4|nr:potassium/proton antiporter [Muribaculum sp.]
MEITPGNIMLIVAILLFFSVLVGKAGSKYGMPALLAFLGIGMVAGVDGFGLQFDSAVQAEFIGMISLCIILFSGGLDTDFKKIRPVLAPGLVLATLGVLVTTVLTGVFIHEMMRVLLPEFAFGWAESLLLAAIMSSTDSASVFSILNSSGVGLKQRLKPTLELESGSNDPMAYLLVILLISVIESGEALTGKLFFDSALTLVMQLGVGVAAGFAIGYATVKIVNAINSSNEFLYPVMVIACCFFAFTLTGLCGGNSYLAVYVAGLVVGNSKLALKRTIATFFGGFTWLVQIIMFLTLGLLVNPHELLVIIVPGVLLGVLMILIARPVAVFLCMAPFRQFSFKAKAYVSWVGLRGAVPIIFATYALMSPQVVHARFMFNIVFFITILSLLIQGTTVNTMAKWLGLDEVVDKKIFNVELPEEIDAVMHEQTITASDLADEMFLSEMTIPEQTLVIFIKRGDKYIVPKGNTRIYIGDKLLLISDKEKLAKA